MDQEPLEELDFDFARPRFIVVRTVLLILFMASCVGAFCMALIFNV